MYNLIISEGCASGCFRVYLSACCIHNRCVDEFYSSVLSRQCFFLLWHGNKCCLQSGPITSLLSNWVPPHSSYSSTLLGWHLDTDLKSPSCTWEDLEMKTDYTWRQFYFSSKKKKRSLDCRDIARHLWPQEACCYGTVKVNCFQQT